MGCTTFSSTSIGVRAGHQADVRRDMRAGWTPPGPAGHLGDAVWFPPTPPRCLGGLGRGVYSRLGELPFSARNLPISSLLASTAGAFVGGPVGEGGAPAGIGGTAGLITGAIGACCCSNSAGGGLNTGPAGGPLGLADPGGALEGTPDGANGRLSLPAFET